MDSHKTIQEINEAYIWRYFAGQASSEEKDMLAQWMQANEMNKAEFHRVKELFYSTQFAPIRSKLDKKAAFTSLLRATEKQETKIFLRPWMKIAAMITIVLAAAMMGYYYKAVSSKSTTVAYIYSQKLNVFTLPDNSIVSLNKHSQLFYHPTITDKRAVDLTGEAYFDIQHNADRPFEITVGSVLVRVLGTAFNVNATNKDSIVISVTRGRVKVMSLLDTTQSLLLTKDQSACFVRNSFCSIQAFPQNVLAWKNNVLQFKATPLCDVVKNISVYFDTNIQLNSKAQKQQLTVKIKDPQLDSVLQLLRVMYNLEITKKNSSIVLKDNDRY